MQKVYKNNAGQELVILSESKGKCLIKFLEAGYEREVYKYNLKAGKVKDPTAKITYGGKYTPDNGKTIFKNNAGHSFIILSSIDDRKSVVQFINTGFTTTVYNSNLNAGKVRDPYEPSYDGIGYSGVFDKKIPYWKKAKQLWSNMIKRCYCDNYPTGYYGRGITVDKRWQCFANFLEDLPHLDNFELWLNGNGMNLDKDLKIDGNKVYCKEACGFVHESINKAAGARNGKPYTKKEKSPKIGKR